MKYQFLLWANALVFSAYLAGHLFDIFIIIPNWKSGTMEDIILFNDFFHNTNPVNFYRVIMPISTAFSLFCFIAFFRKGNPMLALITISLLIDILIDIVTIHYFQPINNYLFLEQGGEFVPALVKQYVTSWVTADYLRVALITIGFYTSLRALHFSYYKR